MVSIHTTTRHRLDKKDITYVAEHALKKVRKRGNLEVVFVGKQRMRSLNRSYRGKDYATDVLSFSYDDSDSIGTVIICMDVAHADAKRLNISLKDELAVLLVHGIVHLAGFSHGSSADAVKMEKLEKQIHASLRA